MYKIKEETISYLNKKLDDARKDYDNRIKNLSNKFFNDNHIPLQVGDKVICIINEIIYEKSYVNAVVHSVIIDKNKTLTILCLIDENKIIFL